MRCVVSVRVFGRYPDSATIKEAAKSVPPHCPHVSASRSDETMFLQGELTQHHDMSECLLK